MKKVLVFAALSLSAPFALANNPGLTANNGVSPDGSVNIACNCGKQGASGTISAARDGRTMHPPTARPADTTPAGTEGIK